MTDAKLILDNRVNISEDAYKVVRISGVNNSFYEINAEGGNTFTNTILFNNIVTPNLDTTVVSRNLRLKYDLTISGLADYNFPSIAGTVGATIASVLRAFPLQSVCDTINLQINGATSSIAMRYLLSATQRTLPYDYIVKEALEEPCMADNVAYLLPGQTALTSQQVMSSHFNSDETTRGSFVAISNSGGGTYVFSICENLMVSPLTVFGDENYLANINTLSIQLIYSQIQDMLVRAGFAAPITAAEVAISNPKLELTYIQVSPKIVEIPRLVSYPYESLNTFTKQTGTPMTIAGTTAVVTSQQLQSDTLRLISLPSRIYVFARPQFSATRTAGTYSYPDAFFSLGTGASLPNLSITLGTRTGLMSSASSQTLYRMSKRNGYRGTFYDFLYGSGSLLVIDPVEDLGVNPETDVLPSEDGSVNFQVSCNFSNVNFVQAGLAGQTALANFTSQPEIVVVAVYAGVASITPENCVFNLGQLTDSEKQVLLNTAPNEGMLSSEQVKPTIQGAGLFSKVKNVASSIAHGAIKVAPHAVEVYKELTGKGLTGAGLRRRR